jgi:hypothetical protein
VQQKNPGELPASRSNTGAGTEKRPLRELGQILMEEKYMSRRNFEKRKKRALV